MRTPEIFLRLTKILGKVILGLLLIMIIAVAIVHLPPAQLKITRMLSNYLSSKTGASVSIQTVEFSILGNVIIKDLAVWDRDQKIFSAHKIEASSDIVDLISGDLIFDNVHLAGIEGKLIQSKEGLNIQFIIDAFRTKAQRDTGEPSSAKLTFKKILLENIAFEFSSTVTGMTVVADLGMFTSQNAKLFTNPTCIKADQIILQHTIFNVLSAQPPDATKDSLLSKKKNLIGPDFGTGINFEIKDLELTDNDVSFHRNEVMNTTKFDPDHLSLQNIQVRLSNILMEEDSLSATLQSLSAQLPGFVLENAKADLKMNRKQMFLSGVYLTSGTNELHADVTAPYDFKSSEDSVHAKVDVALRCQITPGDLAYFFSDSVVNQFSQWGSTSLALQTNYAMGMGSIKMLNLTTGKTQINAEGMLYDVLAPDKISWSDVVINAAIGSDLKNTIAPFLQKKIRMPADLTIQLRSSGNPKELSADAKIFTEWGNVKSVARVMRRQDNMDVDMDLIGEHIDLREWLVQPSLGSIDLSVHAVGIVGEDQHLAVSGFVSKLEILDQAIRDISFQSTTGKTNLSALISIADTEYRSEVASEVSFDGPLTFTNAIQWDNFSLGRLLRTDSTFKITGNTKSKITIDQSLLEGYVEGRGLLFQSQYMKYMIDTMFVHALVSPASSDFTYFTEHAKANLVSNFDIRDVSEVIQRWSQKILEGPDTINRSGMNKTAKLDIELNDASFIKLLGFDVDEFSSLRITGELDEQAESATLQGASGKFRGYGVGFDTLYTNLKSFQGNVASRVNMRGLSYNSIQLENLDFDLSANGDTTTTNLRLANDTLTLLDLRARILATDSGRLVYPDKLLAFDNDYSIDPKNPVYIKEKSVSLRDFKIARNEMQINLDGDLNDWDASFRNLDLTLLNVLLSRDTTIINKGQLAGDISYSSGDRKLDLKANIDSLSLYNSNPLTISVSALSQGNEVPFDFLLTNEKNKIDLKGRYFSDNTTVDAVLLVDVNNPEVFQFLVSGIFDELKGSIEGRTTISGPLQKPALKGVLRFRDMGLTTANPRIFINVKDDSIVLENTALYFNNFTIYDKELHPLTVTGNINLQDYRSLAYDLQISSEQFNLYNNPDSTSERLRGLLVIDSDIKLKGSGKNTNIESKLAIKDATRLTFVTSTGDIGLTTAEGIIDFVDPVQMLDSAAMVSGSYYDSLIASLPEFNLHSTVTIEDDATFRVIINEQSGDFIEASGRADLDVEYDRTGNLNLSGNYTINKGLYRLSFYDLVKKNFELVPGSSINWSGSPENGSLNIKATHTVQSNSIGLIGHEIGENEKSIYKRSLDYEVGINIGGTVDRPVISFLLDLPQDDKVNYPVLANKLDRMRQPEYQSELNKQVFGLLVLGGFLPEASSANVSSNLVATTALSNSVNALLASQLNRFASQHIKGVSIDVGIQSYSDYSAPGGKTQTAMDFRVTKSLMNDRLSVEIGGDFDINQDQSGSKTGNNYRGDIAIIYDLTGSGDKKLKLFNNETYDIVYQEIRNTGVSLIFIRETDRRGKKRNLVETASKDK